MFEYLEAMMKKTLVICSALLALTASLAFAQGGGGINLAWDDCYPNGHVDKTFACNTNSGVETMYGSFLPPHNVLKLTGNEMVLHFLGATPTLPAWWQFKYTGSCRTTAASASFSFLSGPYTCVDYTVGGASGSIASYVTPWTSAADARMKLVWAVASSAAGPVDFGTEYYSFALTISNAKTVGTGLCAGCSTPLCIVLDSINLTQPVGAQYQNKFMYVPAPRQHVTWQGGTGVPCPAGTPTKAATWGSLKSLYR